MQTIRRGDGSTFATVNQDGERVFLVMRAPDGYSGREASWLLSLEEVGRLADALDKAAVELACRS